MFKDNPSQWILGTILLLSSLGVIIARKPIYSSLSFLLTLLTLATLYLQLSAEFIAVMQVLVYAGAILVIFMFVIVLFQDAHRQISMTKGESSAALRVLACSAFLLVAPFVAYRLLGVSQSKAALPNSFGDVEALGQVLYLDFFFPFEAVILLFLIALVGAVYIAKKA